MSLHLYQRITKSDTPSPDNIDFIAGGWTRIKRDIGGYYSGQFVVTDGRVTRNALRSFFDTWLGHTIKEKTYGLVSWEGFIYKMNLVLDGVEYVITLEPDWWHNWTNVYYSNAAVVDIEQGTTSYPYVDDEQGSLLYLTTPARFQDDTQDFSAWETTSGDATHRIVVINDDDTVTSAYLGAASTVTNPNDTIAVYKNVDLSTAGWNGTDPTTKTPSTYKVIAVGADFQDTGQDFSDWETTSDDAVYRIQVKNTDDSVSWGYIGASSTTTNPDDTIAVYQDQKRERGGWNDTDPSDKTPDKYQVIQVSLEGSRSDTGESTDDDSIAEFGRMEYVISLPGTSSSAAEALRDRHITQYAWPRSRAVNQVPGSPNQLSVTVGGFWGTLQWRYRKYSETAGASTIITNLTNDSEFVTPGVIEENTLKITADAYPQPQKIGDLITRKTGEGDASGNVYKVGVYRDRKLNYELQPTEPTYYIRSGVLVDLAGNPAIPELLDPGFVVVTDSPTGWTPPGGNTWDRSGVSYVSQVEWSRDTQQLRLSLAGQPGSVIVLRQQITAGSVPRG